MKKHICKNILQILICVFVFIILFSNFKVNATDTNLAETRTYTVRQTNTFFTSSAGYSVQATVMVPDAGTLDVQDMPLVVMCHGYTGNKNGDDNHFITLGSTLAKNGITAITIDFPGCGASSADDSQYTLTNMYADIDAAIDYMINNYSINTSQIGLVGHSMGGRVASLYTQNGSHSVQALALWAPANGDGTNGLEFLEGNNFGFNYSQEFVNQMNSSHPNSALSSFSGSIYLAIDGVDASGEGIISSNTMNETANAVRSAGGTVETDLYRNTNHNFNDSVGNGGQVVTETANFISNTFLGRDIASDTEGGLLTNTEEIPTVTIEDIIFNRVPILDVNFFSDTAGGETVNSGSPVDIIRNSVATWYVAFRNLAIVSLAVIIIYAGIRMAISTIPQAKAKYKTMLIGWVQAIVIVLVIHMIMIVVLNLNSSLIATLQDALDSRMATIGWTAEDAIEGTIYETIRTRAYAIAFGVAIPATIMYVALFIIKIRFLWVYLKRLFTIVILIIIAPFIGAKYAIDATTGKKGTSFSSWLFDFTFNVLIQAVHAVVYTVLISSAISFAFDSIVGYIIALIMLNFILSADEIFRNIFEFDKRSSLTKDTAKQEGYKEIMEDFAGAVFAGQVVKGAWGFAKGVGRTATGAGKTVYNEVTRGFEEVEDNVNNFLDSIDRKIENAVSASSTTGSPKSLDDIRGNIANIIHYQAQIRRLSRKKGTVGVKARHLKNAINSNRKKRYTANFKLVKNTLVGVGSVILAIPLTVVNTTSGAAMMTKGILTLKKTTGKKHYKKGKDGKIIKQSDAEYKQEKYTSKRDKQYSAVTLLQSISDQEDEITDKFAVLRRDTSIPTDNIDEFKKMQNIILVEASGTIIDTIIKEYIEDNHIKSIDNSSINGIIDEVADKLGIDVTGDNATKNIIGSRAKSKVIFMNEKKRAKEAEKGKEIEPDKVKYTNDDVIQIIQESISETRVEKKFTDVSKDLFTLDRTIKQYKKKAKTTYREANRFLENL